MTLVGAKRALRGRLVERARRGMLPAHKVYKSFPNLQELLL